MADTAPSAKYLQARISHLSLTLLQRFQALLDTAHDKAEGEDGPAPASEAPSLPPEEVASKQLDIEVGSTALIRAAEDLMALTRGMKELWLFGGLNTVGENEGGEEQRRRLREDVVQVRRGLEKWLMDYPHEEREGENGVKGDARSEGEMNVDE